VVVASDRAVTAARRLFRLRDRTDIISVYVTKASNRSLFESQDSSLVGITTP
jgi:hypothetical protein